MNHINRLIIQARKAVSADYQLAIGFVKYDEHAFRYVADPRPFDGNPGSGTGKAFMPEWWHNDWLTKEEATDALHRLFDGFGIPENNTVIFLMDYGESGD